MNILSNNPIFTKVLEEAPFPIGIYEGPELRFVFINAAGLAAIRMKKEDVFGKPYGEVLSHASERIQSVLNVFKSGEPFNQKEMPLIIGYDDQGNPITEYIDLHSLPAKDDKGNVIGVASFGIMSTDAVKSRHKLEEESFRSSQILNHLSTGFFSVDKNWNFNYANPASELALGLPPQEVIGKNVWKLHPQLINSEFYHAYHRSMNERVVVEVTNYYPEQDKWYHTTSYPLDEGIAVSFTDITKRKKAEEARALSDERFHALTEAMPQLVWMTDPDGSADYFNSQWLSKTGTKLEDNYGLKWLDFVHPDDRENTRKAWELAMTSGLYDVEYRLRMANGSYRWHVARGIPTLGEDKKVKQWIGTTTDIEEQKRNQVELEKAVNARDVFLSIASHELKTPLTVIMLQSEMTQRKLKKNNNQMPAVDIVKFADSIDYNVQRITRVVDDMLDISRVTTGKLNLNLEMVQLDQLIHETVERMQPLLLESACELKLESNAHVKIFVDKFRIEQVLANLLTNAARYGKGHSVIISTNLTDQKLRISVKDFGPGIDPSDHQRIFERFERATAIADGSGLGLGLFIVKTIIELHKGSIQLKSELGKGAEFIIDLPLTTGQVP